MIRRFISFAVILLSACGGAEAGTPASDPTTAATTSKPDIVDTAASAGNFKTLLTAVKAAGLEQTLHGDGPFTVLAPTDEAFAKLPPGTVDSLLKPENKAKLTEILELHVIQGRVPSSEVVKLTSAKTMAGKELAVNASGGTVQIGSAKVVKADVEAKNGVIHVIDTVILP